METKAQIQLRFHLICSLSSDSMWSHPEIPRKPHLCSTWPRSRATARSAQRQPVSLKHSAEESKSRWRRNSRRRRWDWCNAVYTVCRRSLGNERAQAVITLWFQMALSCMCIASAWMCALMISSRWWFTWWYLIACHHLTCRTNCAVLIRTEYQRCILHVIVLMFSFLFLIVYSATSNLRFFVGSIHHFKWTNRFTPPYPARTSVYAGIQELTNHVHVPLSDMIPYLCRSRNKSILLPVNSH